MKTLISLVLLGCLWVLTACGAKPTVNPTDGSAVSPSTRSPATSIPMPTNPILQDLILQAKTQLAQKLKINPDQITVSEVNPVQWPDASLGCPQSGVVYAQVLTPGYQIMLEVGGKAYTFHTDRTSRVILCDIRGPDEIFLPP